jgi:D-3-phosphoglycerate dehydrogenase
LARLLAAFEVRILATDCYPVDKPDWVEALWPAERLDELLPLVDIVVLCVPLNPSTRAMIDAARLRCMKPGGLLVNVARGPLVVEADLVDALQSGHLAGAVMDVTEREPLPRSSKLWDLPQVIITPHVGGQAAWRNDKITELFCRNLRRWQEGLPLVNFLSDKALGFPIRGIGYPIWGES